VAHGGHGCSALRSQLRVQSTLCEHAETVAPIHAKSTLA
jgi:hypothetical protein